VRRAIRHQLVVGAVVTAVGLLVDWYTLTRAGSFIADKHVLELIVLGLIAVVMTWYGVVTFQENLRWHRGLDEHPAFNCPRFGTPPQVRQALNYVLNAPGVVRVGPMLVTPDWLLLVTRWEVQAVYFPTVAWCYKQVTEHKSYGVITVRKSYAFQLRTLDGTEFARTEIPEYEVDQLLRLTSEYAPAAVCGHTAEIEKLWTSDRPQFLKLVAYQRDCLERESGQRGAPRSP
jgi:hypothetical protein